MKSKFKLWFYSSALFPLCGSVFFLLFDCSFSQLNFCDLSLWFLFCVVLLFAGIFCGIDFLFFVCRILLGLSILFALLCIVAFLLVSGGFLL